MKKTTYSSSLAGIGTIALITLALAGCGNKNVNPDTDTHANPAAGENIFESASKVQVPATDEKSENIDKDLQQIDKEIQSINLDELTDKDLSGGVINQ